MSNQTIKMPRVSLGDNLFIIEDKKVYQAEVIGLRYTDYNRFVNPILRTRSENMIEAMDPKEMYYSVDKALKHEPILYCDISSRDFSNVYLKTIPLVIENGYVGYYAMDSKLNPTFFRANPIISELRILKDKIIPISLPKIYDESEFDKYKKFFKTAAECVVNFRPEIVMLDD